MRPRQWKKAVNCRFYDDSLIDQARQLIQQFVPRLHVVGLVQRAGEHELPVQAQALALEQPDINGSRIVDEGELALGCRERLVDCGNCSGMNPAPSLAMKSRLAPPSTAMTSKA